MSKGFNVRSNIKNYKLYFTNNIVDILHMQTGEKVFFLIDSNVGKIYFNKSGTVLPSTHTIKIKSTEKNKSIAYCYSIIQTLVNKNIRRDCVIIAVGGGIVQDIASFISSILFRGLEWIFIPTTLLAQADSCLGGKTSINFGLYKNLLGNFYPPSKIYIDSIFLKTLPVNEIKSGMGEMLHFFLIDNNKYADKLRLDYNLLINNRVKFKKYIRESLLIKKKFIEIDEFDRGRRKILNYGHTFGHAIETISNYSVNHGQAVTMGMDIANYISWIKGYIDRNTFCLLHQILIRNLPPYELQRKNLTRYIKALSKDKKNIGTALGCILTTGFGKMKICRLRLDDRLGRIILSYFRKKNENFSNRQ